MSKENERNLGQENTKPESNPAGAEQGGEDVEGYEYCNTTKKKCLNDCIWPLPKAVLVDIN